MQNQEKTTSHTDVMPAMAEFLMEVSPEDIQKMPATFQFIFELELESENMDDVTLRIECLRAIRDLKTLTDKLKPFTEDDVRSAVYAFKLQQKSSKNV
jgi:folate-dependent tRNA-U54 methylase TrmFO/GidA